MYAHYGNDKLTCQAISNLFMTIEKRLKEERERIGLSQSSFGGLTQVVKQTVIQWEKGVSAPNAIQLAALSQAGVDVMYIVTGVRSMPMKTFGPRQQALLDNYEHSDDEGKKIIEGTASLAAQSPNLKRKPN